MTSSLARHLPPDRLGLLLAALGVMAVLVLVARLRPRLAAGAWLAVICFVPCWIEVTMKYSFPAATILTMLLALALFPTVPRDFGVGDWLFIGFFIAATIPFLIGVGDRGSTMVLLTYWGAAYLLGRTLVLHTGVDWLYRCAAVLFTIVAVLAVIEFTFSWNPFVGIHMSNGLYDTWSTLQQRGGVVRAEGAFGHSIALGASVALVIPLVIAARFSFRTRAFMVLAMLACEVVTFSRAGMICGGLGVALMAVFGREGLTAKVRGAIVTVLVVVAVAATPMVTSTYASAGVEASNSAEYRFSLTSLVSDFAVLGKSPDMYVSPGGNRYVGRFQSIDSALILVGLTYGLLPLLIAVALLIGGIYLVATRAATAPTIALVAQIPAFLSVALITQYQVLVWFMAGMAVCTQVLRKHREASPGTRARPAVRRSLVSVSHGNPAVPGGTDLKCN